MADQTNAPVNADDVLERHYRALSNDAIKKVKQDQAALKARQAAAPAVAPDAFAPEALTPGVERWPVKTGTDADVASVTNTANVTVEDLLLIERPTDLPFTTNNPAFQSNRDGDVERTTYTTSDATIVAFKLEKDGDYHIVIQGATGNTMIVEIPDPDDAFVDPASPFKAGITKARADFDAQFADNMPEASLKRINQSATIKGVGFFDILHGQTGVAHSGIELHPVIDISFGP